MHEGNTVFFEISPEDMESRAKLVEGVPGNWLWIAGLLEPSAALLGSGKVLAQTSLVFEGGKFNLQEPVAPTDVQTDLFDLVVEGKCPRFIRIDRAGYDNPDDFQFTQRLLAALLRKNYIGSITFYKDLRHNNYHDNSARCHMAFASREPRTRPQPPYVRLEWDPQYGGSYDTIKPIAELCRALQLREYKPASHSTVA
jgi:hypothetical protein